MERLTRYGTTIGFVCEGVGSDGERRVLDAAGRTIGYLNRFGTFDLNRRRLADHPDAGLLIQRPR